MRLKKIILCITAMLTLFAFSTTAFADLNLGSDDGTGFGQGTTDNGWAIKRNNGTFIYDGEGLRVTVCDSQTNTKVSNTIDITGNQYMSSVENIRHFANNGALISKPEWLEYVGAIYNALDEASIKKFDKAVSTRYTNEGYICKYVPELASLKIIDENNTSNLEKIKAMLGDKNFIIDLCGLVGGGITYDDFKKGKYKIVFEPVAYFRYGGSNIAMTATECGVYNIYLKHNTTSEWFYANNLAKKLGPVTHSNLPRAAFLETKDMGIQPYKAETADYWNGVDKRYNSDNCLVRCMGIGILSASGGEEEKNINSSSAVVAEYHTDTNVYTSFYFRNDSETDIISGGNFSIFDSNGETPRSTYGPISEQVVIGYDDDDDEIYAYLTAETGERHVSETASVKVYVNNPEYAEKDYGVPPYKLLGSYNDGEFIKGDAEDFTYTIRSGDRTIKSGTVSFSCPSGEEAMGWFDWRTPKTAQDVTITIKSNSKDVYILDDEGELCTSLTIKAKVDKVTEKTPPDPKVDDKRPSWQNIYTNASVLNGIAQYAPVNGEQELTWYVWTFDWYQTSWWADKTSKFRYVDEAYQDDEDYIGAPTSIEEYYKGYYGVDNRYYASKAAIEKDRLTGSRYQNAVILSGGARKVEYSVRLSADMEISPSDRCYTATYSNSSGMYTMKSGYGIQIEINAHLSGDTDLCTGSQTANVLFPEFNYNTQSSAKYNRLLEKSGNTFVFKKNPYSTYNDRVHFTPIWFPDDSYYTVYAEVFDVWCPAGQLSVRLTDQMIIKGNVYDDWHVAPEKP